MIFKAVIANTSSASAAQGVAMGIMALSFCFSGFLVTRTSIPDYFIWIYWIMPYSWIIRLLAVNEFTTTGPDGRYDVMIGPPQAHKRMGVVYLEAFAIQSDSAWIGYGFMYMVGVFLAMFVVYTAGLHYRRLGASRPVVSKKPARPTLFKVKARAATSSKRLVVSNSEVEDENEEEAEEGRAEAALSVLRGLSVQPPQIDLMLRSLGYRVPIKGQEDKILLHGIDAVFKPRTMTALMGSSGAGWLSCLCDCFVSGSILSFAMSGSLNRVPQCDPSMIG